MSTKHLNLGVFSFSISGEHVTREYSPLQPLQIRAMDLIVFGEECPSVALPLFVERKLIKVQMLLVKQLILVGIKKKFIQFPVSLKT